MIVNRLLCHRFLYIKYYVDLMQRNVFYKNNKVSNAFYCNRILSENYGRSLYVKLNPSKLVKSNLLCCLRASTAGFVENEKLELYLKNVDSQKLISEYDLSQHQPFLDLLKDKDTLEENLKELDLMKKSEGNKITKEMLDFIEEEEKQCMAELKEIYNKITDCLLPKEDFEDCDDIVLEISAGVGGEEAMLFASDLLSLYCGFLDYKGWQYSLAEKDGSELGGLRHGSLLVSGPGAYNLLQHEAGVHRVQRVPATEKSGRIHTSTVSVAILPQPSDVQINIKDSDLKIETKRSSGAGGQHVNTTDSAVRVTHIPTGLVVECQTGKHQFQNKTNALKRLQAKLYERELNEIDSKIRSKRKIQVGTSSRSEKIRTYNFRDDRISDHRISTNVHNLKVFLEGGEGLDKLLNLLTVWRHEMRMKQFIDSLPP